MKTRCVPGAALAAVLIVFLLSIPFSAQAADPPDPADDQVILYEHTGFEGENIGFMAGTDVPDLTKWNLLSGGKWNDRISSIAVGKNVKVILWQHINYAGDSVPYGGDGENDLLIGDLHAGGWGDRVSSLQVTARPVQQQEEQQQESSGPTAGEPAPHQVFLFEEADFGGQSLGFTYDNDVPNLTRWNLPSGEKWNDRISSLKAGKDTRITLYQNSNYGGASVSFEGDGTNGAEVPDLHVTGWGNAVSSLKVRKSYIPKANEVFLFEHENYDGAGLFLYKGRDIADLRAWSITGSKSWNDRISSMKIGRDVMVYVCTDINSGGVCVPYRGDGVGETFISSLHGEGWGDRISSLKVRERNWDPASETPSGSGSEEAGQSDGEEQEEPEPHQAILFEHSDFTGDRLVCAFDSEMPDLTKIFLKGSSRSWNDAVSAVKVGKNAKLVLFEHINYESPLGEIQGEGQTVKAVELHSVGWGDKVSSFRVRMSDHSF